MKNRVIEFDGVGVGQADLLMPRTKEHPKHYGETSIFPISLKGVQHDNTVVLSEKIDANFDEYDTAYFSNDALTAVLTNNKTAIDTINDIFKRIDESNRRYDICSYDDKNIENPLKYVYCVDFLQRIINFEELVKSTVDLKPKDIYFDKLDQYYNMRTELFEYFLLSPYEFLPTEAFNYFQFVAGTLYKNGNLHEKLEQVNLYLKLKTKKIPLHTFILDENETNNISNFSEQELTSYHENIKDKLNEMYNLLQEHLCNHEVIVPQIDEYFYQRDPGFVPSLKGHYNVKKTDNITSKIYFDIISIAVASPLTISIYNYKHNNESIATEYLKVVENALNIRTSPEEEQDIYSNNFGIKTIADEIMFFTGKAYHRSYQKLKNGDLEFLNTVTLQNSVILTYMEEVFQTTKRFVKPTVIDKYISI
ncbi:MAG: hypothetical protein N2505_00150 [Endomicrobia bacterium]|nr:hypothetical protein [Endomicrobiia bacterium]